MRERLEQEGPLLPEEALTVERFNSIASTNIAGIIYDQHSDQYGTIQRLSDKIVEEKAVRQYLIWINPYIKEEARAKSFLLNLIRVQFDIDNLSSERSYISLNGAFRLRIQQEEVAQEESERFYNQNQELTKEAMSRLYSH